MAKSPKESFQKNSLGLIFSNLEWNPNNLYSIYIYYR